MLTSKNVAVSADLPYLRTNTIKKPKPRINIAIIWIERSYFWTFNIEVKILLTCGSWASKFPERINIITTDNKNNFFKILITPTPIIEYKTAININCNFKTYKFNKKLRNTCRNNKYITEKYIGIMLNGKFNYFYHVQNIKLDKRK